MKYVAIMTFLGVLGFSLSAEAVDFPFKPHAASNCVKEEKHNMPEAAAIIFCDAKLTTKCTVKCNRSSCKNVKFGQDCLNDCREGFVKACRKALDAAMSK